MTQRAVIAGAGQAGMQCAFSLRQNGWPGEIVLLGAETHPPYQRPPLSKAYLAGEIQTERLWLKGLSAFEEADIALRLGETVSAIDRRDDTVVTSEAETLAYSRLFLATGSRPRRLDVPGVSLSGVGMLREIDDVARLAQTFAEARQVLVVGGGFIGLEVAAVARKQGADVTVVEAGPRVLGRVTGPQVADFYRSLHEARGVTIKVNTTVRAFEGSGGRVTGALLSDGGMMSCDLAVIGIGIHPNDEIGMYAGLETDPGNGIQVDADMRTSDPKIYAIGDCANAWSGHAGRRMRIESVANAIEQARIAAAHACGLERPEPSAPWFWSDQYDVKLQSVGILPADWDDVILRGDPQDRRFATYYLSSGLLVAVDAVNSPADFVIAKRLLARGHVPVDPGALRDPGFDMRTLLAA